jgi:hypothetical protein
MTEDIYRFHIALTIKTSGLSFYNQSHKYEAKYAQATRRRDSLSGFQRLVEFRA